MSILLSQCHHKKAEKLDFIIENYVVSLAKFPVLSSYQKSAFPHQKNIIFYKLEKPKQTIIIFE